MGMYPLLTNAHYLQNEPVWVSGKASFSLINSIARHPKAAYPGPIDKWILDTGSLTQCLLNASQGDFRVTILSQSFAYPKPTEQTVLNLRPRSIALVREVILSGKGQPWVFARSVIPAGTLTGRLRKLKKQDCQPLGSLLFSDPGMYRNPIEVAQITPEHNFLPKNHHLLPDNQPFTWGRRSVFFLDNKPLLVNEVFLPVSEQCKKEHVPLVMVERPKNTGPENTGSANKASGNKKTVTDNRHSSETSYPSAQDLNLSANSATSATGH